MALVTKGAGTALTGTLADVVVANKQQGNELQGTFRLSLDGRTTGEINFDASAGEVESKLEALANVGDVSVTEASTDSDTTQVRGKTWTITFLSNTFAGDKPNDYETGYSTAWGANVGDVSPLGFLIGTYSSTNAGSTPTYSVGEPTKGTPPVNGYFRVRFNTVGCTTCLVQLDLTSGPIRHDAAACNATNSVKTILEQMGNVGEVEVSRINSNTATTGGYKWFVTFWTDKGHLNPGDVPTFGIMSSLTDGTIAATASEDIRGNVLRGSFMVGATAVPWDATDIQMRDAVQAMETNRKVRVTTAELDKWGAHSWDITFLSGDAYTPPGTHNYDPLVPVGTGLVETGKFDGGTCNSAPQCKAPAAVSALLSVTTTQDGSQELGGTFTLFIGTPNPLEDVRVLPFDASPDRIRLELQELSTVDTVFVTRIPYRDPVLGDEVGWNADPVANGRIGGWRLQITFVANPGDFVAPVTAPRSIAFPPGSMNRDLLVATDGSLTPAVSYVTVSPSVDGATQLGGDFVVSLFGEKTASIAYAASDVTMQAPSTRCGMLRRRPCLACTR